MSLLTQGKKFQCTLEHDSNSTWNIFVNIDFLNMNKNETEGSQEEGGSVFCIAASALQSKQQNWNSIFQKTFLSKLPRLCVLFGNFRSKSLEVKVWLIFRWLRVEGTN